MFSLELESDGETKDILIAELWEQGSTGIVEADLPGGRCLLRAFFEDDADEDALVRRFPSRVERHAPRDWVEYSRANWAPMPVGDRFYLVPDWLDDPAPPGRFRIEINPGLACGTGFHEATQLCLEALEEYLLPHMTVLDIGAGSGILSSLRRCWAPAEWSPAMWIRSPWKSPPRLCGAPRRTCCCSPDRPARFVRGAPI